MENFKLPINYDVNIEAFSNMLSSNLTNSYKIYWFKSIFDYANKGIRIISMDNLLARMLANAWNICVNTDLCLGSSDKLREDIFTIIELYPNLKMEEDIDIIENKIINITNKTIKNKINRLLEYVPYRLLTPFLKDCNLAFTLEKTEKYIEKCSMRKKDVLYKICNKTIFINESYYEYIRKNNFIILKWINYNLENYLKKKNEEEYFYDVYLKSKKALNEEIINIEEDILKDNDNTNEKEEIKEILDNKYKEEYVEDSISNNKLDYKNLILTSDTKKYTYLCNEETKEDILKIAGSDIIPPKI